MKTFATFCEQMPRGETVFYSVILDGIRPLEFLNGQIKASPETRPALMSWAPITEEEAANCPNIQVWTREHAEHTWALQQREGK